MKLVSPIPGIGFKPPEIIRMPRSAESDGEHLEFTPVWGQNLPFGPEPVKGEAQRGRQARPRNGDCAKGLERSPPVSYTHLDVYKRQAQVLRLVFVIGSQPGLERVGEVGRLSAQSNYVGLPEDKGRFLIRNDGRGLAGKANILGSLVFEEQVVGCLLYTSRCV